MIDRKKFFDQQVKNGKITYENIRKIATGQRVDPYFKDNYEMTVIDLSKQQKLDADPGEI